MKTDIERKQIPNEEVLKILSEISKKQLDEERVKYEQMLAEKTVSFEPNEKFLEFAREYDKKEGKKRSQKRKSSALRLVATFLICVMALGGFTFGTSEAFRHKVLNIFFDKEDGAVVINPESKYDLLEGFSDYLYPTTLHNGFKLTNAEQSDSETFLRFASDDYEIKIFQYDADGITISHDTDYSEMIEFSLAMYSGYIFLNRDYDRCDAIWQVDDKIIEIRISKCIDSDEFLKIIDGMKKME